MTEHTPESDISADLAAGEAEHARVEAEIDSETEHKCEPMDIHTFKFAVEIGFDFNDKGWGHNWPDVPERDRTTLEYTIRLNRDNIHEAIVDALQGEYGKDAIPWLSVVLQGETCETLASTNAGE